MKKVLLVLGSLLVMNPAWAGDKELNELNNATANLGTALDRFNDAFSSLTVEDVAVLDKTMLNTRLNRSNMASLMWEIYRDAQMTEVSIKTIDVYKMSNDTDSE